MEYKLSRSWDNKTPVEAPVITITIAPVTNESAPSGANVKGLLITVDAPYFDDPKLPEDVDKVPGRVDRLWDYEVVEVFFLGSDEKYLEIELGPKGHYLVYSLTGVRNVTKSHLLDNYSAQIYAGDGGKEGRRWKGEAFIPFQYLPPALSKFNAYAIYKSHQERTYMALFPVTNSSVTQPDFHRLEFFGPIDLDLAQ